MARTITFDTLRKRFQMAAGLPSLTSVDEFFFKESINSRVQGAWTRCEWPELLKIVERSVAETTDPSANKAVRIDNDLSIIDIQQVWNKNPYKERSAIVLDYKLIDGYLILPVNSLVDSVFIIGTAIRPTYGADSPDEQNIPDFLANYLVAGCLSDFLRGDGQTEKAIREEARAEEYLLLEIDRVERQQGQNNFMQFTTYGTTIQTPI